MATAHLKGTADILYTPPGEAQKEHTLAYPLLISPQEGFKFRRNAQVFEAWKVDLTARETFTVGTPVSEIEAMIRFDDEPDELRDMLEHAMEDDVTLTYRPTGSGGSTYPCKVVKVVGAPPGKVVLTPDRATFGLSEVEVKLHLRRVDGSSFENLLA